MGKSFPQPHMLHGSKSLVRRNSRKVSSPVYDQYQERTINLPSHGTTIASLARQRRQWETLLRSIPRTQSLARDFDPAFDHLTEVTRFGSNPGALRMFEYVPADPQPALVVVLHGCTQTAASYDFGAGWSTLADRHGFVLLLPEQQRANNARNCFNWFRAGDIERGRGEAMSIRNMVEKMIVNHAIDRRRVFVTGLSAGGAMTSVMLATYPDAFAAGAIIAGLPYGTATNVNEAFGSMGQVRARSGRLGGAAAAGRRRHRGDDGARALLRPPAAPRGSATGSTKTGGIETPAV